MYDSDLGGSVLLGKPASQDGVASERLLLDGPPSPLEVGIVDPLF